MGLAARPRNVDSDDENSGGDYNINNISHLCSALGFAQAHYICYLRLIVNL